jgi:cytochrome c-type biogenesis protein CcmE
MRFLLRLGIALAVLLPTVLIARVRGPLPLFGVALVAFGAGQLAARHAGPAVRAALMALSGIAIIVTGAYVFIPREAVDAFRNVDQVTPSLAGRRLRVRGYVVPGSTAPKHFYLSFGDKHLRVVDQGRPRPENLRDGMEVLASGTLGDDGAFQAESLLTRCPDNYDRSKGDKPF